MVALKAELKVPPEIPLNQEDAQMCIFFFTYIHMLNLKIFAKTTFTVH